MLVEHRVSVRSGTTSMLPEYQNPSVVSSAPLVWSSGLPHSLSLGGKDSEASFYLQ